MPNLNRNDVVLEAGTTYEGKEVLKVLKIIISEDEDDQYIILLDDGEKAIASKEFINQHREV